MDGPEGINNTQKQNTNWRLFLYFQSKCINFNNAFEDFSVLAKSNVPLIAVEGYLGIWSFLSIENETFFFGNY